MRVRKGLLVTSGVKRACEYLLTIIGALEKRGENRLPTVGRLASEGRFSPATVVRAVAYLRSKGVLTAVQRGGIRILRSPDAPAVAVRLACPPSRPSRQWQRVQTKIAEGITDGTFPAGGVLPSVKELCQRYGASFAPVKRALSALEFEGKLTSYKRGFRAYLPPAQSSHACLVLLAHVDTIGDVGTAIPRNPEFLRTLERECGRLHLRLILADERELEYSARVPGLGGADIVVGYMLWIRAIPIERLRELIQVIERARKPLAVMDEDGDQPLQSVIRSNPRGRLFTVANSMSAGNAIGLFLIATGHRRVGYISPVDNALYCRNRLAGISQAFEQAGLPGSVKSFVLGKHSNFEQLIESRVRTRPFRTMVAAMEQFTRTLTQKDSVREDRFYSFYSDTLLLRRAIQAELLPVLNGAIYDRSITALVGVNDWVALIVMAYARECGVRVPQELVVAGFDDTFEAFSHGLTSYDYNMPALVQAMLEHVLSAPPPRRKEALAPMEIPGLIRARSTTSAVHFRKRAVALSGEVL